MSCLLHNMSMRPHTAVRWTTGGTEVALVCFALDSEARASIRERARSARAARALRAELDAYWQGLGLRGAALVYEAISEIPAQLELGTPRAAAPPARLLATDASLATNVLGRARSCLLLPEVPLELGGAFVARTLWSDDPRLVDLARRTGAKEVA